MKNTLIAPSLGNSGVEHCQTFSENSRVDFYETEPIDKKFSEFNLLTVLLLSIFSLASCKSNRQEPKVSLPAPINSSNNKGRTMSRNLNLLESENLKLLFKEMEELESFQPLLNLCSDSVVFKATIREGTPISGVFAGKKKVTEYFNLILPEVASFKQLMPLEFYTNSNSAVLIGDDEYTIKKNGAKHHSPYAMVLKIKDNLIEEISIIQDLSVLWEAYRR
jgi:hypothetical protein